MTESPPRFRVWLPSYWQRVLGGALYLLGVFYFTGGLSTYGGERLLKIGMVLIVLGAGLSRCRWHHAGMAIGSVTSMGLLLDEHWVLPRDSLLRAWLVPGAPDGYGWTVAVERRGFSRSVLLTGDREEAQSLVDHLESAGIPIAIPVARSWAAFLPPFSFVFLLVCVPALRYWTPTDASPLLFPLVTVGIRLWLWLDRFAVSLEDGRIHVGSTVHLPLANVEAVETTRASARLLLKDGSRHRVWTRGWLGGLCLPFRYPPTARAMAVRSLIQNARRHPSEVLGGQRERGFEGT